MKLIGGCQGSEEDEWKWLLNRLDVFFSYDGNVLKLNRGGVAQHGERIILNATKLCIF